MEKMFAAGAAAFALAAIGVSPAQARPYDSFTVSITRADYAQYSGAGTLAVTGYASYKESDCILSHCEMDVGALFTLYRPYGYGPVARFHAETRGSPWLHVRFRIACRWIPRHATWPYTVVLEAQAPNGLVRTASQMIRVVSCRR